MKKAFERSNEKRIDSYCLGVTMKLRSARCASGRHSADEKCERKKSRRKTRKCGDRRERAQMVEHLLLAQIECSNFKWCIIRSGGVLVCVRVCVWNERRVRCCHRNRHCHCCEIYGHRDTTFLGGADCELRVDAKPNRSHGFCRTYFISRYPRLSPPICARRTHALCDSRSHVERRE